MSFACQPTSRVLGGLVADVDGGRLARLVLHEDELVLRVDPRDLSVLGCFPSEVVADQLGERLVEAGSDQVVVLDLRRRDVLTLQSTSGWTFDCFISLVR